MPRYKCFQKCPMVLGTKEFIRAGSQLKSQKRFSRLGTVLPRVAHHRVRVVSANTHLVQTLTHNRTETVFRTTLTVIWEKMSVYPATTQSFGQTSPPTCRRRGEMIEIESITVQCVLGVSKKCPTLGNPKS